MKQLFYLIAAGCILTLYSCGGNERKDVSNDSIPVKTTSAKNDQRRPKHLAYLTDSMLKVLERDKASYAIFLDKFKVVSTAKFNQDTADFNRLFNVGTPAPSETSNNYLQLPFSIFEKYNEFQKKRGLQTPEFKDPGTQKISTNMIRIYPAIDPDNNFYLVFLRELNDLPTGPVPSPIPSTDRDVYYAIRYKKPFGALNAAFYQIDNKDTAQTNQDIKKFQTTLKRIDATPHTPSLSFRKERSLSYTIADYDELLGNTFFYWNIDSEKLNSSSNYVVQIFPGIDKDIPSDVRFRLMLKLFQLTPGGYREVANKAIFDNMDPCPQVCPDASKELNYY